MARAGVKLWSDLADWAAEDILNEGNITILTYGCCILPWGCFKLPQGCTILPQGQECCVHSWCFFLQAASHIQSC